jgi:hypothetical protein
MAQADPGLNSVTKYLRTEFPWKKDFYCKVLDETFTYQQVRDALIKIQVTDPLLHRLASYRWASHRSRNDIADGLYMDSSTLKRHWDKFGHLLMNYLVNGDLIAELEPIDIIHMD